MKKNQKQIGLQILSERYGLNVKANPTLAFLSIVCCCMSQTEVKEFFGLSDWEFNRIFDEKTEECSKRWHRSPKMAFKTLESHMEKQDLDDCQIFLSSFLLGWVKNQYLCDLAEEVEALTGEDIFDSLEEDEFLVSEQDLNIIGQLMWEHVVDIYESQQMTA